MADLIDRDVLLQDMTHRGGLDIGDWHVFDVINEQPTIEAEPVRHGRWIECDYKHFEHGFMEIEPNAGLCCSECRTAFQKKKMTYKQYCAACGTKMDEVLAENYLNNPNV